MMWNVKNKDGNTPIQVALNTNNDEIIKELIEIESVDKSVIPAFLLRTLQENY